MTEILMSECVGVPHVIRQNISGRYSRQNRNRCPDDAVRITAHFFVDFLETSVEVFHRVDLGNIRHHSLRGDVIVTSAP